MTKADSIGITPRQRAKAKKLRGSKYITYHRRPKNDDGSESILTIVRVPGLKWVSKCFRTRVEEPVIIFATALEQAQQWAESERRVLLTHKSQGGRVESSFSTFTIRSLINKYLDDADTKLLKSLKTSSKRHDWWVANYGDTRVLDFGPTTIQEAKQKLLNSGLFEKREPATVNRFIAAMSAAWTFGIKDGLIPQERRWPIKMKLKEPDGRVRFLSDDERARLLEASNADPLVSAAIRVSLGVGLRKGELLKLTWADVDLENGSVTLLDTKNGSSRSVHVPPMAIEALKGLKPKDVALTANVFMISETEPLSQMKLEPRWRQIRRAAKLVNFRWHDLRHSCASILVQNGAHPLEIAKVLGHKSLQMTQRYAHLAPGAKVTGSDALNRALGNMSEDKPAKPRRALPWPMEIGFRPVEDLDHESADDVERLFGPELFRIADGELWAALERGGTTQDGLVATARAAEHVGRHYLHDAASPAFIRDAASTCIRLAERFITSAERGGDTTTEAFTFSQAWEQLRLAAGHFVGIRSRGKSGGEAKARNRKVFEDEIDRVIDAKIAAKWDARAILESVEADYGLEVAKEDETSFERLTPEDVKQLRPRRWLRGRIKQRFDLKSP